MARIVLPGLGSPEEAVVSWYPFLFPKRESSKKPCLYYLFIYIWLHLDTMVAGLSAVEMPLYVPADLPCSELWSIHNRLSMNVEDSELWEESGDMCKVTYRGAAVSTHEGRTSVSYNTMYEVHKELLSQLFNTIIRARERETRQVGDPFIAPYLAGLYQRLGLEYASLLAFPRITLAWRRLAAVASAAPSTAGTQRPHHNSYKHKHQQHQDQQTSTPAAAAADADATTADPELDSESRISNENSASNSRKDETAGNGAKGDEDRGETTAKAANGTRVFGGSYTGDERPPSSGAGLAAGSSYTSPPPLPPAGSRRAVCRVTPLEWQLHALHREMLLLEPWKPGNLRLLLGRTAATAETHLAAATAAAGGHKTIDRSIGSSCTAGGNGFYGSYVPWLGPGQTSLLSGASASGVAAAAAVAGIGGSWGGGFGSIECEMHYTEAAGEGAGAEEQRGAAGGGGGQCGACVFWLLWLVSPTFLVALDALKAAPENPWMAMYICVIATCRTLAEWRAFSVLVMAPPPPSRAPQRRRRSIGQRLGALAAAHFASAAACGAVTGLLNTWLPLLGHGAAAAVVWLHVLVLPAVAVAVMAAAGVPAVVRQLSAAGGDGGGGALDDTGRRGGGRDRRHPTAAGGGGVYDMATIRRALQDVDNATGGGAGGGGNARAGAPSGRGGSGGGARATAAAAAAAQVHWPPALDVPSWLEDGPNTPEAFRCPITQSLMREPAQASSGVTYERPAIMQWLDRRRVDPVTHVPLKRHRLAPNLNLRHMIEAWVQDRVEARRRLTQRIRDEIGNETATRDVLMPIASQSQMVIASLATEWPSLAATDATADDTPSTSAGPLGVTLPPLVAATAATDTALEETSPAEPASNDIAHRDENDGSSGSGNGDGGGVDVVHSSIVKWEQQSEEGAMRLDLAGGGATTSAASSRLTSGAQWGMEGRSDTAGRAVMTSDGRGRSGEGVLWRLMTSTSAESSEAAEGSLTEPGSGIESPAPLATRTAAITTTPTMTAARWVDDGARRRGQVKEEEGNRSSVGQQASEDEGEAAAWAAGAMEAAGARGKRDGVES